ncbi:MAG: arginine decarboxylase, pyruvoyl-dependent [Syntrophobacterales bacterium]|nr:MAG: arginine decarboxylase, pyruvoyl-dependent [Syntrophobacterales bacterium]
MIYRIPKTYFLVSGSSEGYTPLNAFDGALLNAGIGNTNLVKISSIIPPHSKEIQPITFPQGTIVPTAYACIDSDIPGEIISAAVAIALPKDEDQPGLIMEYSARGHREEIELIAKNMAHEGMKTRQQETREIKFISVEYKVKKIGAAFAAVILWQ